MRIDLQPAYILHRRAYRNTSLLVELFTKHHGRICAVARGAQRSANNKQVPLQPFQRVLASWSGRGEVQTITHIEASDSGKDIGSANIASAFYLNELVMRLLHRHDPHEYVFDSYEIAISVLASGADGLTIQNTLRLFEKRLLDELGYGLVLDHDVKTGEALLDSGLYYYLPEQGPVERHPALTGGVAITGGSLLALAREASLDDAQLREIKQLMRCVLRQYLGDKPLQSRMMYNRIL